jgi:hypothetical protein
VIGLERTTRGVGQQLQQLIIRRCWVVFAGLVDAAEHHDDRFGLDVPERGCCAQLSPGTAGRASNPVRRFAGYINHWSRPIADALDGFGRQELQQRFVADESVARIVLPRAGEHQDGRLLAQVGWLADSHLGPGAAGGAAELVDHLGRHVWCLVAERSPSDPRGPGRRRQQLFIDRAAAGADGEITQLTRPEVHPLDPGMPTQATIQLRHVIPDPHGGVTTQQAPGLHSTRVDSR